MIISIAALVIILLILRIVFMVLGLAHKKEWTQNIKDRNNHWKKLSLDERDCVNFITS